ncbi:Uncharacterised protein [Mycobacteroides abscessus subsp. abscessus]|nr:Uncharacterised protein [Mycobacteroides abscessus subsp. abscessus]
MERNSFRALARGDAPGVEVRVMLVVDSDAELDGDGDVGALGRFDRGCDDSLEQGALVGDRRAATLAGHLRDRAAEVHVDVVGEILVDDHLGCLVGVARIHRVELHRPRILVRAERGHVHGDRMPLDERAGGDHLADVQTRHRAGAGQFEFATQRAERHVGDARHGCEHHGTGELDRADSQAGVA